MNKNSNITRQNMYNLVYRELGISKVYCSNFVDSLFDKIIYSLKSDRKVKISLFGTFSKKNKKSRVGRNPKTKEEKIISSRNVVSFKPSKFLIKKINRFA
jgi:integration host factor subunit alpha